MKLSKKAIDIIESSIKKFIDEYEPFDHSGKLTNFVRIDPYILWNKYQKRYTINLFYIFDDNLTLFGKHSAYEHGKKILNKLKTTLSFIRDSDSDIHIVTKDDYKKYTDVLIPKVRNLIPENKMNKRNEEYYQKIDRILNKFLSTYKSQIDDDNFLKYVALSGEDRYGDFTVKIIGLFKKPFSKDSSNFSHSEARKIIKMLKEMFPVVEKATFSGGGTSTVDNFEQNLNWEKSYMNRKIRESNLPFKEKVKDGVKLRTFDKNIDDHELKWHRDERDRIVEVVNGNGWKFQMDNELPKLLKEGDIITIPSEVYHRAIKGHGDLVIKIQEL
jgi:hypothetical protein